CSTVLPLLLVKYQLTIYISLALCFVLMFGNSMLLTSYYASSLVIIWVSETPSLLKIHEISRVWWRAPVVPATWEAEAGEWREPRRQSLQ
uniref:Uncharacterized protein n=1 Tax=Theropithecus gelada TaxID=9565 RepID=A0A8D2FIW4_THEGE